jgi:hypothetical protein
MEALKFMMHFILIFDENWRSSFGTPDIMAAPLLVTLLAECVGR